MMDAQQLEFSQIDANCSRDLARRSRSFRGKAMATFAIDYRFGSLLNSGNLKYLVIDLNVIGPGGVIEGIQDAFTGDFVYTDRDVSDVVAPSVPYELTDDFTIYADLGGGLPNSNSQAFITTADGNDTVVLRSTIAGSSIEATVSTAAGDDIIDISSLGGAQNIDGGSGNDTLIVTGNTFVSVAGIETIRMALPATAPGAFELFGVVTGSLVGVQTIEFTDPLAYAWERVRIELSTAGIYDFSTIQFLNAGISLAQFDDEFEVGGSSGDDVIIGGNNVVNRIYGWTGDDTITGGSTYRDYLTGSEGNDSIQGGGGLDLIYGDENLTNVTAGSGLDALVLSGVISEYSIDPGFYVTNMQVTDLGAADESRPAEDGTAYIWGIEVLHFNGDDSDHFVPVISLGGGGANDERQIAVAGGLTAVGTVSASDVEDGVDLTYNIIDFSSAPPGYPLTDGVLFNIDSATGGLSFINPAPAGTYVLYVRATDSEGLSDSQRIVVTVGGSNTAPVADDETGSTLEDTPLNVAAAAGLLAGDTDADGDPLAVSQFTVAGDPAVYAAGASSVILGVGSVTIYADGSYDFSPAANYNGSVPVITYTVSDGHGGTDTGTLTLNVTPVNDAPLLTEILETIAFDENLVNNAPQLVAAFGGGGNPVVTDPDGADFGGGRVIVRLNVQSNFDTSVTPMAADSPERPQNELGIRNQGIGAGQIGLNEFTVTFGGIVIGEISAGDDGEGGHDLIVNLTAAATAEAVSALIQNLTYMNTSDNPIVTRVLTVQVEDGDGGISSLSLDTVSSNRGGIWAVSVNPQNDAPVLALPLTDQTSAEDQSVSFVLPASSFTDVDGDALTLSANLAGGGALPSWLSFNSSTRTFSGTPPLNFNGVLQIVVTASDGALSASDQFALTISPVNDAPVAVNDTGTAGENEIRSFNLLTNDTDADNSAAQLTLTSFSVTSVSGIALTNAQAQSTFFISGNQLRFSPGTAFDPLNAGQSAHVSINYIVSDGAGGTSSAVFQLTVNGEEETAPVNVITGTNGNNDLYGTGGVDLIRGFRGQDFLFGFNGDDTLDGGAGADQLFGGGGNDLIDGGDGYDLLYGGAGDDVLIGGENTDLLFGGAGADVFKFGPGDSFSGNQFGRGDFIGDFNRAQGDKIDLSLIDALYSVAGDQAFTMLAARSLTQNVSAAAGTIVVQGASNFYLTTVFLHTNGDGVADFTFTLDLTSTAANALQLSDFIL